MAQFSTSSVMALPQTTRINHQIVPNAKAIAAITWGHIHEPVYIGLALIWASREMSEVLSSVTR